MRDQVLGILSKYLPGKLQPSGGNNVLTTCPFHGGGQERKPSFSVELSKGLFHCFTCHVAGDIAKLLRDLGVASTIVDREMGDIKPALDKAREQHLFEKKHAFVSRDPFKADYVLPETVLGVYEFCPLKLVEDGFDPALLQRLGIGYDRAQNRIMWPLRDMHGNLAGFSAGAGLPDQWPKYKVYQGRTQDHAGRWRQGDFGPWFDKLYPDYRCENHDFLWNFHRVWPWAHAEPHPVIYVVEGFKAATWLIQNGYPMTVALMGSYASPRQQQMLHKTGATVVLFLDNDAAGQRATTNIGDLLWWPMYGKIKVVQYPKEDLGENTQPDDYTPEAVRTLIEGAWDFRAHLRHNRS